MRSTMVKAATTLAAAATSVALTAGSATAATAPTFTVTAGGVTTGSNLSVTSSASAPATITDTTTGAAISCASFAFLGRGGAAVVGSGQAGNAIVRAISKTALFRSCVGPQGVPFDFYATKTWRLDALSGNLRFVNVRLGGVSITVTDRNHDGTCTFVLTGAISGQYVNGTGLRLPGTTSKLTASGVTAGCAGVYDVRNGDVASFRSTLGLTALGQDSGPAGGPLVITAP